MSSEFSGLITMWRYSFFLPRYTSQTSFYYLCYMFKMIKIGTQPKNKMYNKNKLLDACQAWQLKKKREKPNI